MKRAHLFLCAALLMVSDACAAAAIATLCSSQEQIIFSCATTKNKVVSLCASSHLTDRAGYLQYRFGSTGQNPELVFPSLRDHPNQHFLSGSFMYSGGGGAFLKFSKGEYTYAVFTGIGKGWEKEGVIVRKSGTAIANIACQGAWTSTIGPALFEKVNIPRDPEESEFEVP